MPIFVKTHTFPRGQLRIVEEMLIGYRHSEALQKYLAPAEAIFIDENIVILESNIRTHAAKRTHIKKWSKCLTSRGVLYFCNEDIISRTESITK